MEARLRAEVRALVKPKPSVVPSLNEIHFGDVVHVRKVGEGSFGDVFLATWQGQAVAKKQLKCLSPAEFAKLKREARLLGSVVHPNVVRLWGACLDPAHPFLVCEFADLGDLFSFLHGTVDGGGGAGAQEGGGGGHGGGGDGGFNDCAKLSVVCAITLAIAYMHNIGIVHRDIKR